MQRVADVICLKGDSVYGIGKDAFMREAAQAFLDNDVSMLLVFSGDDVVGVFRKNDLLRQYLERSDEFESETVGRCATPCFFSTFPDVTLDGLVAEMLHHRTWEVPVFDGQRPIGMITFFDILAHQKSSVELKNEQLMRYIHGQLYETTDLHRGDYRDHTGEGRDQYPKGHAGSYRLTPPLGVGKKN